MHAEDCAITLRLYELHEEERRQRGAVKIVEEVKRYLQENAYDFRHRFPAERCETCFHIDRLERILGVEKPPLCSTSQPSPPPAPTPGKD